MTDNDLPAVAGLRWQCCLENQLVPAMSHDEFVEGFVCWARANKCTHHCLVLVDDDVVIGMAWLAIIPRVPSAQSLGRVSGDVQSVYVIPRRRDGGLGGRLIDAVVELADRLGIQRVTVHSSKRAVGAYARHGFAASPVLLQTDTER
ncbi:GNAT family N-acetyltransferase [Nocardia nova]|uniref:GNAT family N-acetyltransferase n=1 Tax=Nocardia nova TaxID=37330 RepID=UPI0033DA12B4